MLLGSILLTYLLPGLVVGCAFVVAGASRVLDGRPPVSQGARLVLLPGAMILWPLIAKRWVARARRT